MNDFMTSAEKHLRLFLDYLSVEKGLSDNTLVSYSHDLKKLFLFFGKEKISWDRGGRANHYFDSSYYARVAAEIKGVTVRQKQQAQATGRYKPRTTGGYKIGR